MVRLRRIFGEGGDDDTTVMVPTFLIGRASACDLRLACPGVSRTHCELVVRDDYVAVRDLGSTNGTWVNDEPVVFERQLSSGDVLRLGTFFFEVLADSTASQPIEESLPVARNDQEHAVDDTPEMLPAPRVGQPQSAAC